STIATPSEGGGFSLVTAPTAGNANLRAQRGVFLLHRAKPKIDLEQPFSCMPLEKKLPEHSQEMQLLKFTLPVSQARTLLRLLAKDGINGAALFPSYEGAAKAAREELCWDTADRVMAGTGSATGGTGGTATQQLSTQAASPSP